VKPLKTAREINEEIVKHVVELLVRTMNESGISMKRNKVLVLDLTYRAGIKEFYNSPALKIIEELMK